MNWLWTFTTPLNEVHIAAFNPLPFLSRSRLLAFTVMVDAFQDFVSLMKPENASASGTFPFPLAIPCCALERKPKQLLCFGSQICSSLIDQVVSLLVVFDDRYRVESNHSMQHCVREVSSMVTTLPQSSHCKDKFCGIVRVTPQQPICAGG